MEHCPGGELFDLIASKFAKANKFKERETAEIMYKLLKAVAYIHGQMIAHRDIKPENIMIGKDGEIKLIDFGLASKFISTSQFEIGKILGTPQYLAPEAFDGMTSLEVDIWSLGVLMFVLLSGSYPYAGSNYYELKDSIRRGQDPDMTTRAWKRVSDEAKDLVKCLLQIEPKKRIKAKDALEHQWFKHNIKPAL